MQVLRLLGRVGHPGPLTCPSCLLRNRTVCTNVIRIHVCAWLDRNNKGVYYVLSCQSCLSPYVTSSKAPWLMKPGIAEALTMSSCYILFPACVWCQRQGSKLQWLKHVLLQQFVKDNSIRVADSFFPVSVVMRLVGDLWHRIVITSKASGARVEGGSLWLGTAVENRCALLIMAIAR